MNYITTAVSALWDILMNHFWTRVMQAMTIVIFLLCFIPSNFTEQPSGGDRWGPGGLAFYCVVFVFSVAISPSACKLIQNTHIVLPGTFLQSACNVVDFQINSRISGCCTGGISAHE